MTAHDVSAGEMRVRVNGVERLMPHGTALVTLFENADAAGAAIARNREVVPKAQWAAIILVEGDEIELVRPVQGGAI